jgi:hypothetical protein
MQICSKVIFLAANTHVGFLYKFATTDKMFINLYLYSGIKNLKCLN